MRIAREEAPPVMQRRIRIFETAVRLFSERGFEAVGIREIAQRAGVSKSLINRHFRSKDGLRAAVDADVMERFDHLLRTILGPEELPADPRQITRERAKRFISRKSELLPLLKYLRHSLLENSEAGHTMFKTYLNGVARQLKLDNPGAQIGKHEPILWLLLAVMFMQLGPILLQSHIEAITGRSPFDPNSVRARSLTYGLIEAQMRVVRDSLRA